MAAPASASVLAIDTAGADCSAALIVDDAVIAARRETIGRGHAERLVPMVAELLADAGVARPAAILVDCGPGSFTGVRVGLAAAIGMGLGWGVPVRGYSATAVLAAAAFAADPALEAVTVAMAAGHGELFVERYAAPPLASIGPLVSLPPAAAAACAADTAVTGSGAAALVAARGHGKARPAEPDAAHAVRLAPALLLPARPIYGRPPDARPIAA